MSVNKVNSDGSLSRIAGGSIYSFAPIGAIVPYASSKIPEGYLLCDGREISRTEYAGLFAVIGTAYGTGDGSTTFNIPDLRGKFAEGTPSGESVGTVKSAGLPNITGSVGAIVAETSSSGSGAFSMTQNGAARPSVPGNSDNWWRNINFSARNSNSIYGNSTTVQPPAVCINYIIKAKDVAMIGGTQTLADKVSDLESNVTELQAVVPSGASSSNQLALASKTLSVNSSGGSLSGAFTKRIVKINFYGNNLSLEETVFILGMKKNWNTNRYYSEMYLVNISSIGLTVTKLNKTDSVHTNLISNFKLKKESSSSNNYYLEIATNNTGSNDYTFLVTPYLGRATLTPICEDVGDSEEDVYTATINRMITTSDLTSTITSGSSAPITSGGVFSALNTVTSGTATNTSNVSSGACTWVKIGRIATVTLNAYTPVAYTGGDRQLATGLPKPVAYTAWGIQSVDGTVNQLFSIGTDGVLMGASGSMKSGAYYQTLTYLCQA